MKKILYPYLILSILFCYSCKEKTTPESIKTETIVFTKEGEFRFFKEGTLFMELDIEFAENDYERETGLMHRTSMEEKQGMLFLQDNMRVQNFYMKNTQISLDLVFIGDTFKVVSFQKNAKPFDETSLSSGVPAKYVLEVNAGLADKWNLAVGDSISFTRN